MNTDPSQEVQTSPPVTPLNQNPPKNFVISIDSSNALNMDLDGTWTLHEALGALILTGINLYANNTQSPGINYLAQLIGQLATSPNA